MTTTVSVIIPAYNAGETIERCIQSLVEQEYPAFEIIIIDDGSAEACAKKYDECAKDYINVKVIHETNAGVSAARNKGIKVATGDFISFVDSDDWVTKGYLLNLVEAQKKIDADFVFSGITTHVYNADRVISSNQTCPEAKDFNIREFVAEIDKCDSFLNSPCKCLFKRSIINKNKVQFPKGIQIGEDKIFVTSYLLHCEKVSAVHKADYQYVCASSGTLSSKKTLAVPNYNFSAAELRTELKKKYNIDCGSIEYSKQLYNTLIFNFLRVFGKRLGYSAEDKYRYCKDLVADETTRKLIREYSGYNIQTKVLRLFFKLRMPYIIYLMWKVRSSIL